MTKSWIDKIKKIVVSYQRYITTWMDGFDIIRWAPGYNAMRLEAHTLEDNERRYNEFPRNDEIIIASAILDNQGQAWVVMKPGRHHHCIRYMAEHNAAELHIRGNTRRQGFVTNYGRYITRPVARRLALANGQVKLENLVNSNDIFSEDLWDTPIHLQYKG